MKMDQMTIAQVQKHMSKVLAKYLANTNQLPWSVDDEIDTHMCDSNPVTVTPSRNQREGYYWGNDDGKPDIRLKHKPAVMCSSSTLSTNRKQRKLMIIRRKNFMSKIY